MKLIESKTLGTSQAAIEFTSIPQDGTDLVALISSRGVGTNAMTLAFNTGGAYTNRRLFGTGSSTGSDSSGQIGQSNSSTDTANTFGNTSVYIPNYTGSTAKSYSVDSVSENNGTAALQIIIAGLWSGTSAITSMTFTAVSAGTFAIGSTVSLYGVIA